MSKVLLVLFPALLCTAGKALADVAVQINLSNQEAVLVENGQTVAVSPISSGRSSLPTPTGNFSVIEKDPDHRSTIYGTVLDSQGRAINRNASTRSAVPPGGRFLPAPMPYFMRFTGGAGMHAGYLPGYAASHGCVRMPRNMASFFFSKVRLGTRVSVIGRAP